MTAPLGSNPNSGLPLATGSAVGNADSGVCTVQALYDNTGAQVGVRVLNAAPLIRISDQLVKEPPSPYVESGEGLFVIKAVNGTVRYRLLTFDPEHGGTWSAQRIDKTDLGGLS